MIKIIDTIDYVNVYYQYLRLEKNIVWQETLHKGKQSGVQFIDNEDPWLSAVGKSKGKELEYTNLNPYYKNTVFEKIIEKYNLTRTRLMWLGSNSCYSFHRDSTVRIHIPLITNDQCFLIFKDFEVIHMPVGKVYWVDTTLEHTAINGHLENWRLHLVGCVEK
jgi:hypothetical protein